MAAETLRGLLPMAIEFLPPPGALASASAVEPTAPGNTSVLLAARRGVRMTEL